MKKLNRVVLLAMSVLLTLPNLTAAVCTMTLTIDPSSVVYNYTGSAVTVNTNIIVTRTATTGTCKKFRIYITKGGSADYNRKLNHFASTLGHNIYKNSGLSQVLKDLPDVASPNDYIDTSFSGNQATNTVTVYANLQATPGGTVLSGGNYTDTVSVKLYRDDGEWVLGDTYSLSFSTVVPREVNISLVDSGAPYNSNDTSQVLDFGVLQTDAVRSFDLKVYSNAGYSLAFSSANDGKMKNADATINYTLSVNGVTKDLSHSSGSPVEVAQGTGITPAGGINHAIQVTVGNVSNKLAGPYSDYITVVATAVE